MADPRRGGARSGRAATTTSGSTWSEESTNFAVWAPEATAAYVCLCRRRRHRDPAPAHRAVARHLARRGPGVAAGPAVRLPGGRDLGARAGAPVQPAEAAARPLRPGRQRRARAGPGDLRLHASDAPETARPARLRRQGARSAWSSTTGFDWSGDTPQRRRWRDTVIYELHVKGMTQLHDRVPEHAPRHVRRPRHARRSPTTCATSGSPRSSCCRCTSSHRAGGRRARPDQLLGLQLDRLLRPARGVLLLRRPRASRSPSSRQMVKAFHEAGLEVILDVVYNHTAEAGVEGPTLSLPRARRQDLPPGRRRGRPSRRSTTPTGT